MSNRQRALQKFEMCLDGFACVHSSRSFRRYLDYGNPEWKQQTADCLARMEVYSDEVRKNFEASLDWLHEYAISRNYGLGE